MLLLVASGGFVQAGGPIKYLSPDRFAGMPSPMVTALKDRGCGIPQSWHNDQPHNVIRGTFLGKGHDDWAVLCSVHGRSEILVFPQGGDTDPIALAPAEDAAYLQRIRSGEDGFSRLISTAAASYIDQDHDGIEDSFVEKGSVVRYFQSNEWLRLSGAD